MDEVNLLPDHLVDLLLDAAASGCVRIERDGISETLPARFILIGSMNPEEGELRPQFLDRFGLCVHVTTPTETAPRIETIRRRLAYDASPETFCENATSAENELRARLAAARTRLPTLTPDDTTLAQAASLCASLKLDGVRGDLALVRAARAIAAWENAAAITDAHIRQAARLALPHRKRKKPFDPVDAANANPGTAGVPPAQTPQSPAQSLPSTPPAGTIHIALEPHPSHPPHPPHPPRPSAPGRRDTASQPTGGVIRAVPLREAGPLALAPTLTAAALRNASEGRARSPSAPPPAAPAAPPPAAPHSAFPAPHSAFAAPALHRSDLRRHERVRRGAARVLFIVDASGSMGAQRRLSLAKGAATGLLAGNYQKRDEVALMIFRGETAGLLEPFTRDIARIERALRDVPTGGRTPLAPAFAAATPFLASNGPAFLVLFTDGRANVPLQPDGDAWAESLAAARELAPLTTGALVVDCETGAITLGRARELAAALGAECEPLATLDAPSLTLRIRKQTTT